MLARAAKRAAPRRVLPCRRMTRSDPPPPRRGPYAPNNPKIPASRRVPQRRRRPTSAALPAIILSICAVVAIGLFIGLMGVYTAYANGLPDVGQIENFPLPRRLHRRLCRRPGARRLRRGGPPRDPVQRDPRGDAPGAGRRRGPDLLDESRASTSAASCGPPCRTSRPARRSRAPRPSASSWFGCASSAPTCWPIPIAASSARSRRRFSPCASATAMRVRRAKRRSWRCTSTRSTTATTRMGYGPPRVPTSART